MWLGMRGQTPALPRSTEELALQNTEPLGNSGDAGRKGLILGHGCGSKQETTRYQSTAIATFKCFGMVVRDLLCLCYMCTTTTRIVSLHVVCMFADLSGLKTIMCM